MRDIVRSVVNHSNNINRANQSNTDARITSVAEDGTYVNVEAYNQSEIRQLTIMLPFGISSSALDGMSVQINLNSSNGGSVVGVKDPNRPKVMPGEVILYSNFGSRIEMLSDGKIKLVPANGTPLVIGE